MLRTTLTKTAAIRPLRTAAFSTTTRAMAQGDTGAPPKTGGEGFVSLSPPSFAVSSNQLPEMGETTEIWGRCFCDPKNYRVLLLMSSLLLQ